jgi:heat shock protein HspQ
MNTVKYAIGQVVRHNKQHYRGIIIDVDYSFQPQGVHSPIMIKRNIATEHPWYRVLVDNSNHITYVKETLLNVESNDEPICHPELTKYLKEHDGQYTPQFQIN